MHKIPMRHLIAELDGDEMTRILWRMIKDTLLLPFVELNTEYYDLGLENRERTDDAVTTQAAEALRRVGVGVKCATITPNAKRMEEYHLSRMYPSPNGQIRSAVDGTTFRAPIVLPGLREYATGDWTVKNLAEYLAACGLNTRSTPRMPSKPIPYQTLFKVLANPYYKGIVTYKGVQYAGSHETLIDDDTWERVQTILASRINGERNFKHPHFLKGTVYCAYCGSRMIITNTKKKNGTVYSYFACCGRHRGTCPDCQTRHALIPEVERKIEQLYDNIQLPHEVRVAIEEELQNVIKKEKEKYDLEM